jgi:hypothetical protein
MGTISGSGVANVVSTGQFTIPLMKRFGYRRSSRAASRRRPRWADRSCRRSWARWPSSWPRPSTCPYVRDRQGSAHSRDTLLRSPSACIWSGKSG